MRPGCEDISGATPRPNYPSTIHDRDARPSGVIGRHRPRRSGKPPAAIPRRRARGARAVVVVLGAALTATAVLGAGQPARAQTAQPADPLADANREVASARAAAETKSSEYLDALEKAESLRVQMGEVDARIAGLKAHRSKLRAIGRARAAIAYRRSVAISPALFFDARDALDIARRTRLIDGLNAADTTVFRQLRKTAAELSRERSRLLGLEHA